MTDKLSLNPTTDATVLFTNALLKEVAAQGADPDRVLQQAGAHFTFRQLQRGLVEDISDQRFVRIHRQCITMLSAQAHRERNLTPMSKDEVDMLCYCVISCADLGSVIERARRFCAMVGGRTAVLRLELRNETAVFHMRTQRVRDSASALLTDLNGLGFYRRLFSWLIGEQIAIQAYQLYASPVVDREILERFFREEIIFDQPDNAFSFPARLLRKPVVRSSLALDDVLSVLPFDIVRDPRDGGGFAEMIEHIVEQRLAQEQPIPTLAQFARVFNMSRATFQRRLREEGIAVTAIRQRFQLQLARQLLDPAQALKISDIALRLGFSDARSFRRAFVAWTGMTPDAWRNSRASISSRG